MKAEVLCGSRYNIKTLEVSSDAEGSVRSPLLLRCCEEELGSDGDCAAHSPPPPVAPCPADGSSSSSKGGKPYTRRPKPPFSYIALIAMAIRDSASGRLTLAQINDYLMKKFPFFRGGYTGWRNSVRHNLSLNDCFLKVLRDASRPWGKDNYWMLNPHSEYTFADGVFRRRRKRINNKKSSKAQQEVSEDAQQSTSPSAPVAASCAKFTSSFAIDSILSKPFKREKGNCVFSLLPAFEWPRYADLTTPRSGPPASAFAHVKSLQCHMDSCAALHESLRAHGEHRRDSVAVPELHLDSPFSIAYAVPTSHHPLKLINML